MSLIDLDGRVAIVTGAARGLGRAEALELARRGARVVVNDLGSGLRGGADENPAAEVVEEIRALGSDAVADGSDVADFNQARDMVHAAIEHFGRLDILVNNAGILRERMVFNMTEGEWDDVIRVHLKGTFCPTRWATRYWRGLGKAGGGPVQGRVLNTSSEAFLNGAPGQPNYAAAKAGIVQLTLATSHTMAKYGVTANAICPRARTRMTEDLAGFQVEDPDFDPFAPENVTPLVAYLASPDAQDVTGQVFVVYGRMVTLLAAPSVARRWDVVDRWTPELVAEHLQPFFESRDAAENFGTSVPA